jgi:hypothetical protein
MSMAGAALVAAAIAGAIGFTSGRRTTTASAESSATPPSFKRLTFGHGIVTGARFAPDGQTVVYSAQLQGAETRLFLTRLDSHGTTLLGYPGARLFAVSPVGEMAVGLHARGQGLINRGGTLAQAPILGGAPRQLLDDVTYADWNPNGSGLALVRVVGSRQRLEYPPGRVLFETEGDIGWPRISPQGDRVAFLNWPVKEDDRGTISVVDLKGQHRTISKAWEGIRGLAWARRARQCGTRPRPAG